MHAANGGMRQFDRGQRRDQAQEHAGRTMPWLADASFHAYRDTPDARAWPRA
jgi:hypothetical protein